MPSKRQSICCRIECILIVCFTLARLHTLAPEAFAVQGGYRRQKSLYVQRDEKGLGTHVRAADLPRSENLTEEGRVACSLISEAGRRGDWRAAKQRFDRYTGQATPVFNAAMTAAFRTQQYQDGAAIFQRMCDLELHKDEAVYTIAIKLAAKVYGSGRVQEIWEEAVEAGKINSFVCGGRINAFADKGDVAGAAALLDFMAKHNLTIHSSQISSAIHACAKSDEPHYSFAMHLLRTMIDRGMAPTIATFTSLAVAHRRAPLLKLKAIRTLMAEHQLMFDNVFVESYLSSLIDVALGKEKGRTTRTVSGITSAIQELSDDYLTEARDVISQAKINNVRLNRLVKKIDDALQLLQ